MSASESRLFLDFRLFVALSWTSLARLTTSAPEGKADAPFGPGDFRV
jgi:hypothetical protein